MRWGTGSPKQITPPAGDVVDTYHYPDPGDPLPHVVTQIDTMGPGGATSRSFSYDDAGNTVSRKHEGDTQALEWDAEGRAESIDSTAGEASFVYTADGERLLRSENDVTTVYLAGGMELTYDAGTGATSGRRYYGFAGMTIATRDGVGLAPVDTLIADPHGTAEITIDNATSELMLSVAPGEHGWDRSRQWR